jgi:hypothetical protein
VQGQQPAMHHPFERDTWVIPLRRKTQVAEAVDSELQAPKADDFSWGESDAGQVAVVGIKSDFQ